MCELLQGWGLFKSASSLLHRLLENGRAAVFRPFPVIQHYLLLGCNPGSRASAKWEWVINQWTSSTYRKHPCRALASEANPYLKFQYFHADREKWRENKTSLTSWHRCILLTVWCHCTVSPLNLPVLVLAGSMWSKAIPGHRCDIHISVVWSYIF